MSRPPHIDEHRREIAASRDRTWDALVVTMGSLWPALPRSVVTAWGLEPSERRGDWSSDVAAGDAIPGFAVQASERPRRLTLAGRHRFSRYELRWELEPTAQGTALCARTLADFPGRRGGVYRALVIGTGGHRVAVRRLLAQVATRAEG